MNKLPTKDELAHNPDSLNLWLFSGNHEHEAKQLCRQAGADLQVIFHHMGIIMLARVRGETHYFRHLVAPVRDFPDSAAWQAYVNDCWTHVYCVLGKVLRQTAREKTPPTLPVKKNLVYLIMQKVMVWLHLFGFDRM